MDWYTLRMTAELRKHDKRLYASRNPVGLVLILRKPDRLEASDYNQSEPDTKDLNTQLILALTDNWTVNGKPVEWGIEPVMSRIHEMDSWRDPEMTQKMRKGREREQEAKERAQKSLIRETALDMRREFAKATNDINTSTLEKVDNRRKKDAYL